MSRCNQALEHLPNRTVLILVIMKRCAPVGPHRESARGPLSSWAGTANRAVGCVEACDLLAECFKQRGWLKQSSKQRIILDCLPNVTEYEKTRNPFKLLSVPTQRDSRLTNEVSGGCCQAVDDKMADDLELTHQTFLLQVLELTGNTCSLLVPLPSLENGVRYSLPIQIMRQIRLPSERTHHQPTHLVVEICCAPASMTVLSCPLHWSLEPMTTYDPFVW